MSEDRHLKLIHGGKLNTVRLDPGEGTPITVTFWIAYKRGENRPYVLSLPPTETTIKNWKESGFRIFKTSVLLPIRDGSSGHLRSAADEEL